LQTRVINRKNGSTGADSGHKCPFPIVVALLLNKGAKDDKRLSEMVKTFASLIPQSHCLAKVKDPRKSSRYASWAISFVIEQFERGEHCQPSFSCRECITMIVFVMKLVLRNKGNLELQNIDGCRGNDPDRLAYMGTFVSIFQWS
jgi:hypothetical protein